jgi:hypothetical protein
MDVMSGNDKANVNDAGLMSWKEDSEFFFKD